MLLKRFYDDGLAQTSYLIGCDHTGEALVVDANRDVARRMAEVKGVTLDVLGESTVENFDRLFGA